MAVALSEAFAFGYSSEGMDDTTTQWIQGIWSADGQEQNAAYSALMAATEQPVGWAYDAWDDLLAGLSDRDNHVRAICAQVLPNLAAHSDPDGRMLNDFPALLKVTKDERFVTARHALQSVWKVGLAGPQQREMVVRGLSDRFNEAADEKNSTLVRYDIQVALRQLSDATGDSSIREMALPLIELEPDAKYRKKYLGAWKGTG